jgi:broad specificity phosphatase PhoE
VLEKAHETVEKRIRLKDILLVYTGWGEKMTTFYLIRHGRQNYDSVSGKNFVGHGLELSPLTEEGVNQAIECSKDNRLKDCELIISSPYTRAVQTSAILSKNLGLDIKVEVDLREQEFDLTYQIKSIEELKQIVAEERKFNDGQSPYNGTHKWESREDVKKRVLNVLNNYKEYKKVIVVCHGMVIRCLTGKAGIPNCSIHEFIID